MNENNAAQAAEQEIREAFELTYAADADDPACAADLFHFTNGWRACIMSQGGKPVVMKIAVDATAAIDLINDEAARLRAPVAPAVPKDTQEYTLRAMGRNYSGGHSWDRLDTECVTAAADEIRVLRAALASAPVAGEAQPVAYMVSAELFNAHGPAMAYSKHVELPVVPLYAAPQASEAVRGAGIAPSEDVALPPLPEALTLQPGQRGHTDQTLDYFARAAVLADRQQRAAGDERAAFEAAYQADYDDPGAACEREHFGKGYRAALSAQPGAQKDGGSDA